ncbi:MAG: class I SAM-dependent methyltransferase [Candidatus Thiodiazotropha sp.]|jgi:predicted O-methyltransferase YrrM
MLLIKKIKRAIRTLIHVHARSSEPAIRILFHVRRIWRVIRKLFLARRIGPAIKKLTNARKIELLEEHFRNGLPAGLRPGLEYLTTGITDEIATLAADEAEARRAVIASEGEKKVSIWYSPKPGSAGEEVQENLKPSPGKVIEFTMQRVALTGKHEKWGTVLHYLIRGFQCERGIELGSCAGISALYLSSAPSLKKLITVEGSTELSKIAEISLKDRPQVKVVNSLFDEAIDNEILSESERFDFAYIDGHHEKVATIHYFNRLAPCLKEGALVIFDDVSWSYDMRDAWDNLSERTEFSHAIDLGTIGICVMNSNSNQLSPPKRWNLQPITGVCSIGDPLGWKE